MSQFCDCGPDRVLGTPEVGSLLVCCRCSKLVGEGPKYIVFLRDQYRRARACDNFDMLLEDSDGEHQSHELNAVLVERQAEGGGVWVAYYADRSGAAVFGSEIEALRYAVRHSTQCKFVPFGVDLFIDNHERNTG